MGHVDLGQILRWHGAQSLIKVTRTQEKAAGHEDAMQQPRAQHVLADARKTGRVVEFIAAMLLSAAQLLAVKHHLRAENAEVFEESQVILRQWRAHAPGLQQGAQRVRGNALIRNAPAVEQLLQHRVVIHLAADDASLDQPQKRIHQHLGAAVQPRIKPAQLAPGQPGGANGFQNVPVLRAVAVPHDQCLANGIAQRANADLQRAAIGHQAGGVQANGVVGGADLVVGRRKNVVCAGRVGHHHVKKARADLGAVGHEGHFVVDHAHRHHRLAAGAHMFQHRLADVGVAGEAQAQAVALATGAHRLGQHIHALQGHVARGIGVIGGNMTHLRGGVTQIVAGFHEKLLHLDVRRQLIRAQVLDVIHVRIIAKNAFYQRLQEVFFQVAVPHRFFQREGGDDAQTARRAGLDAPVQRVHQRVGLADTQWNAHHDRAGNRGQNVIHAGVHGRDEQGGSHVLSPCDLGANGFVRLEFSRVGAQLSNQNCVSGRATLPGAPPNFGERS